MYLEYHESERLEVMEAIYEDWNEKITKVGQFLKNSDRQATAIYFLIQLYCG